MLKLIRERRREPFATFREYQAHNWTLTVMIEDVDGQTEYSFAPKYEGDPLNAPELFMFIDKKGNLEHYFSFTLSSSFYDHEIPHLVEILEDAKSFMAAVKEFYSVNKGF